MAAVLNKFFGKDTKILVKDGEFNDVRGTYYHYDYSRGIVAGPALSSWSSAADRQQAILSGTNLTGAILQNANLTEAGILDTNFTGADLSYATLAGADLTRANLHGAKGLRGRHLRPKPPAQSTHGQADGRNG